MTRRPVRPAPSSPISRIAVPFSVISLAAASALTGCSATGTPIATPQSPVGAGVGAGGPANASASGGAAAGGLVGTSSRAASPAPGGNSGLAAANLPPGKVVAIDPGHNGGNAADPDAVNALVPMGGGQYKACDTTGTEASDGYTEHAFNFDVAQRLSTLLHAHGITVVFTRTNDTGVGPCVNIRAAIGNDAHADAAISIHADGYDGGGHGFQIIEAQASSGGGANDAASNKLGQDLHTTMLAESGFSPATYIGTDGYESRNDLAGLNLSTVPKVLVECGNMHDSEDLARLENANDRQQIAQSLADGIIAFLGNH